MKNFFLIVVITLSFALTASAQKLNESQVPAAAKAAFQKKYPGLPGKWDKEDVNYEVNFKQNGKSMSAVIDKNGTIIETETDISVNDLPAVVRDYLKKNYPGAKVKEAAKVLKENGDVNYEAEVNNKDVIFDATGKFIKETKD